MEVSIFIAKVIGPCLIVVAAGMMLNRDFYKRVMEDYSKNSALIFIGGMLALIIGIAVVLVHNVWAANWGVIITIYGWLAILKGIWLLVFPNSIAGLMNIYRKNEALLTIHSVVVFVIGLILAILGYAAG